ncbi:MULTISPECIES: hypothetical protein [unclassified Brevibacterium]|uniref:hypothetical protein n=1 Tax=unclassified Brevibacterium TaxID=2614124 RepID=UPI000C58E2CF|nr:MULTISPECIES: hypothetical protein [unclassified Brevibacterium]SMX99841.1 hypothetical protein BSP239C_03048 [Brevibacterium sp. 239c]
MSNQTVYLLFAEQTSPFDDEELIDPLVGIFASRAECLRVQKEQPEYKISWEEREVEDADDHTIESGDTVYAYHYMATYRPTPDGGEAIELLSDAAVEDIFFQEENARKKLEVGDLQVIKVGELRLKGDFQIIEG